MAHLANTHKGWENERLATFLLSKFSFVASPLSIGDDLGSDLICTIFEPHEHWDRDRQARTYLLPQSSFAIQIKSSDQRFDASHQIDYLDRLEMPFLVGVVDQGEMTLRIFSGEYLPILFSHKGYPAGLRIELRTAHDFDPEKYYVHYTRKESRKYRVFCPQVATISARTSEEELNGISEELSNLCRRMRQNLATRTSKEFIFRVGPEENRTTIVMAGSGSVEVFRENLQERLAEAFFNLEWLLDNQIDEFNRDEFDTYRRMHDALRELPLKLSPVLERIRDRLDKHPKIIEWG